MPCFKQAEPVLGGVAEYAGISEIARNAKIPTNPFLIGIRIDVMAED